jgi:hypothetical protein
VPIVRVILVVLACLGAAGQFWQERRRLEIVKRLPGREARDYYEATRERSERFMIFVTILLVLAAVAAVVVTLARRT